MLHQARFCRRNCYRPMLASAMLALTLVGGVMAQTTAFTYQGKLNENGNPANGNYDFQFKLFDTATVGTGTQQGGTQTLSNVQVASGIFTVQVDFSAAAFPGTDRFIEIAVKPTGGSTFTVLSPRQPVAANPYAIHTLNADSLSAACVSCITSSQIQSVQGSQVTGAIAGNQISGAIPVASVPAGSAGYIQNGTAAQATSNFNITGNGTAGGTLSGNVVNAATHYNIGGTRILSNAGTQNLFAGQGAGQANGSGGSSGGNAFFGYQAGSSNMMGVANSFFGTNTGFGNTTGGNNAFFGFAAGFNNTTSSNNSFLGSKAGQSNTAGGDNAFFGFFAGSNNTTGQSNTFLGASTGLNNSTGSNNTLIGNGANFKPGVFNLSFATAIGAGTTVETSNTIALGRLAHEDQVVIQGRLTIRLIPPANSPLCLSSLAQVGFCSSSLRYKTNVQPFTGGLDLVRRLRPIMFTWKDGGMSDFGLGAEEVEQIEPLLTFRNNKGEIEGVKYNQLSAVFINAIKEQQMQIEQQQTQIKKHERQAVIQKQQIEHYSQQLVVQQNDIEALKRIVCASHPRATICQTREKQR